ncbi:alpha/beta fold family hydrolase [Nitzschia inconspicua]|uniref:Alpha/beta fold family hydrolase n=1 Tax=Nitzschia inconspicua TaxID=303405 RepID=A0A9K3KZ68_9STRA|nr:alpha/beta fold family hydrolase [Nitzschia inconspicua]
MFVWTSAAMQLATKLESMRNAEAKLLLIAKTYASHTSNWEIKTFDTQIRRSVIPCARNTTCGTDNDDNLTIHGVHVTSDPVDRSNSTDTPLVLLHGYMNAGAYFYRNFGGLSKYFSKIYALDMLGWGLSSRPDFCQIVNGQSTETAEEFFVESLEAWRSENQIDRMILAGHSFGGYMSVAYCERYPERVERLILLSPVGVPDDNDPAVKERIQRYQSSWRTRTFLGVFQTLFHMTNPAEVLRLLSTERSYGMAQNYVTRRLPEISDPEESRTVADYLYYNAVLPGSGEYFLHSVLNSRILAKKPLISRIPNLKVGSVSFLYGSTDWMDITGGLNTQRLCETLRDAHAGSAPDVNVYMVPHAGHLLMLQNPQVTNTGMIHAAGGKVSAEDGLPALLDPGTEDLHESWLEQALKARTDEKQRVTIATA